MLVEIPDGRIVEFPDAMSKQDIKKHIFDSMAKKIADAPLKERESIAKQQAVDIGLIEQQAEVVVAEERTAEDIAIAQSESTVPDFEAMVAGGIQGITLGFADEIEAAWKSGSLSNEEYMAKRDAIRQKNEELRQRSPGSYISGELVGGLVIPGGAIVKGAKGVKMLATGGATGGLYGAGTSEAEGIELAKDVAIGATLGLAAPLAIQGVVKAAKIGSQGVKAGKKLITGKPVSGEEIGDIIQTLGPLAGPKGSIIANKLAKTLRDTKSTAKQVKDAVDKGIMYDIKIAGDAQKKKMLVDFLKTNPEKVQKSIAQKELTALKKEMNQTKKAFAPLNKALIERTQRELKLMTDTENQVITVFQKNLHKLSKDKISAKDFEVVSTGEKRYLIALKDKHNKLNKFKERASTNFEKTAVDAELTVLKKAERQAKVDNAAIMKNNTRT